MIRMIVGGFSEGEPLEGQTTEETIERMFGDLASDIKQVSNAEFEKIIDRCNQNNWQGWKASWQYWHENGFEEVTQ